MLANILFLVLLIIRNSIKIISPFLNEFVYFVNAVSSRRLLFVKQETLEAKWDLLSNKDNESRSDTHKMHLRNNDRQLTRGDNTASLTSLKPLLP